MWWVIASYPKIHFRLSSVIDNEAHIPKAVLSDLWLVDGLCYPQQSSPSAQRSGLKALIGREKTGMMKEGQQGDATDWWSPVSRQKRGIVSWGRKRQMLKELFVALIERIVELTEHLVHQDCCYFCRLQLVTLFNASFLCVLIQIMCKHKKYACTLVNRYTHTHTHTHTAALLPEFDMCFY